MRLFKSNWFLFLVFFSILIVTGIELMNYLPQEKGIKQSAMDSAWLAPSLYLSSQPQGEERKKIIYGSDLIAHTAKYLGPKGSVAQITNGMNCQNCHLDAGTRAFGNNYGAVYSTYPKLRARSGVVEDIYKRVNDCMERSLNGAPLDSNSNEMQAIYAYIKWLGKDVPKGTKPFGSGIERLPFLDRAADPGKGKAVYINSCQSCHGANGEGVIHPDGKQYAYPPLWGPQSYNDAAGLFRLSSFAGYVKANMPFNQATHQHPLLSNEEAWDVAAFVNSQTRPHKDQSKDWPDVSQKPVDHPFGPYADAFTEKQHKYGPFKPIENFRKTVKK